MLEQLKKPGQHLNFNHVYANNPIQELLFLCMVHLIWMTEDISGIDKKWNNNIWVLEEGLGVYALTSQLKSEIPCTFVKLKGMSLAFQTGSMSWTKAKLEKTVNPVRELPLGKIDLKF